MCSINTCHVNTMYIYYVHISSVCTPRLDTSNCELKRQINNVHCRTIGTAAVLKSEILDSKAGTVFIGC